MIMNAHEDICPGSGLTDAVADALEAVMQAIIPSMFKSQQPWALMGSLASVLQGMPDYVPPDIDLVTTTKGAYVMEGAIGTIASAIRPVSLSTGGPYTSHFGIFEVNGIKVEVMGDLIIKCEDGMLRAEDHWEKWSERVRVLHFRGLHIPVIPLEWQVIANAMLHRPDRVAGCAKQLLAAGYNREYLDEIMKDQAYGERTLQTVREALHLDE
jgi:hypothetical protein